MSQKNGIFNEVGLPGLLGFMVVSFNLIQSEVEDNFFHLCNIVLHFGHFVLKKYILGTFLFVAKGFELGPYRFVQKVYYKLRGSKIIFKKY